MELLDSRRLRHFVAVYEERSMGQAAAKLGLSPAALSKSIRCLEEDLCVRLFERSPLGVAPTVFGDVLAKHARMIGSEIHHAEAEIAHLRDATKGHVTVGVSPGVVATLMPRAVHQLQTERPGIQLTITEGLIDSLIPALRRGEVDLVVGAWRQSAGDLHSEVVHQDQLCVVAGAQHPLAGRSSLPLEELLAYPWALRPETQRWRDIVRETFGARGLPAPKAMITTNSVSFIRTLLLGQRYIAYIPRGAQGHASEALTTLSAPELVRNIDVTVTYRDKTVLSPAAHAVIGALRSTARVTAEEIALDSASV